MRYVIEPPTRATGRQVLTAAEMRAADARAIERLGVPGVSLMETAGRHVALAAAERLRSGDAVAILIGAGNNGGDGSVAARHLLGWGFRPRLHLSCAPERLGGDAGIMFAAARAAGVPVEADLPTRPVALVVDGLLGTGLTGQVRGRAAEMIAWIAAQQAPVVAIDIPSGLCADTGRPLGAAVVADETVTFVSSAPGHWLHPGPDHVGRLRIVDIGMPAAAVQGRCDLLTDHDLAPAFAPRAATLHKGGAGHVIAWAGDVGRTGAAQLTCSAALRAGAGLVTLATAPAAVPLVAPALREVMYLAAEPAALAAQINARSAAIIGPGMPTDPATGEALRAILGQLEVPVVLDADGLNHCVGHLDRLRAAVITPHPGEAARLLETTIPAVQADRVGAARALAARCKSVTVLKGAHTLVASPDGRVGICPDGNPGMATAGMGDVLAGIIGALIARGLPALAAARAGVLWHARAGDRIAADTSPSACTAGDVIEALWKVERAWRS